MKNRISPIMDVVAVLVAIGSIIALIVYGVSGWNLVIFIGVWILALTLIYFDE